MTKDATRVITDLAEWLMRDDVLDESTRAEYEHRLTTCAKPIAPELPFDAPKEETHGR